MKFVKPIILVTAVLVLSSCAAGLNTKQKREYAAFENEGVLIKKKDPTLGTFLGILPGFGSFYSQGPGMGITNLILWPFSVLWDPVNGYNGAMSINYNLTKHDIKMKKGKELSVLDDKFALGEINNSTYIFAQRKINRKYDY
ncbi:MAG: putative membrane protein [Psychromonas sp.]|jgi:uncharacterized membrane protein|uniref:hypothetical protein n=1 Tax=Psychromonas sp. TaxID=1884585 RepID=UPI0039E53C81